MFTLEPLLLTSVRVAMTTRVRLVRACVCVCLHSWVVFVALHTCRQTQARTPGEAGRSAHIETKNTNTPLILSLKNAQECRRTKAC